MNSYTEFRIDYASGYVVEFIPENETRCNSWILLPAENLWSLSTRGGLYIVAMLYLFLGIAFVSDLFMSSIEVITSQKRTVYKWDEERQERVAKEVMVWNETVANLTLLALGSSAPEILLATIENVIRLGEQGTEKNLGTFTIVGSAAFNLLMISAVCISSLGPNEVKRVKQFGVFATTSIWSLWAYIWMYVVVGLHSPGVVDPLEAWTTFAFFPMFVMHAYAQDNRWWLCKKKKSIPQMTVQEDPPSVGMRVVHHTNVHAAMHGGKMQRVPSEGSDDGRSVVITCHDGTYMGPSEERLLENVPKSSHAQEVVSWFPENQSVNTTLLQEHGRLVFRSASLTSCTSISSFRFRHAAVNALLGVRKNVRRHSAEHAGHDPVSHYGVGTHKWVDLMYMKGWSPSQGICTGYFLFASEKYSVFEGGGHLEVDVLFARALQIPQNKRRNSKVEVVENSNSTGPILNSNNPNQLSMSSTSINLGAGLVSVDYETREGKASAYRDFQPSCGTLVFREDEYRKQIPINITSDGPTTSTVDFFLILKNPSGNAGLGDPSVAHIVIIGRHEPGEFLFESAFCHSDMENGTVTAIVHREGGFDGAVSVNYQTMDGTALGGSELGIGADYIVTKDTLAFADGEITKAITIDINPDVKTCKNFIIVLSNPDNGARIGERSAVVCFMNNDELAHRLGEAIEDEEDETVSWREQFSAAIEVGGSADTSVKQELVWYDYLLHFLTIAWKLLFAAIPPTSYCNGWLTFICSLSVIGFLTAFVEQLGNLLGCVVGLKQSVTGITIIALGTSLPDTFASRTAARHDPSADAAIGNITGSNSVNVFLGLGLPWVICSMYYLFKGVPYQVAAHSLASSVTLFTICGLVCIFVLIFRRIVVGGELGGSKFGATLSSLFLGSLWVFYIIIIGLQSYGYKPIPYISYL